VIGLENRINVEGLDGVAPPLEDGRVQALPRADDQNPLTVRTASDVAIHAERIDKVREVQFAEPFLPVNRHYVWNRNWSHLRLLLQFWDLSARSHHAFPLSDSRDTWRFRRWPNPCATHNQTDGRQRHTPPSHIAPRQADRSRDWSKPCGQNHQRQSRRH